jgi:hypothetical protein
MFPLKISYKADILTLITFAMSAAALGWQMVNYLQGAAVRLIPPDEIILASSDKADYPAVSGGPYFLILARMSYVNEGATGYNATIKRERIEISIPDVLDMEEYWYRFVGADAAASDANKLVVTTVSDFHAFGLQSGSSESHLTLFQPWPKDCPTADKNCKWNVNYVPWDTFSKAVKPTQYMKIRLFADIYGSSHSVSAECEVTITKETYDNVQLRRWDAQICK